MKEKRKTKTKTILVWLRPTEWWGEGAGEEDGGPKRGQMGRVYGPWQRARLT